MNDTTLARLRAANPLPGGAALDAGTRERLLARATAAPPRRTHRRALALAVAAAAIAVPAVAFADRIGGLFSNQGTPVATTAIVGQDSMLTSVMAELEFPSQVGDLGERDGFHFYVSQKADGEFCFVISSSEPVSAEHPRAISCSPAGFFPSSEHPVIDFSGGTPNRLPADAIVPRLLGFASDGVATVAALDAQGRTIASTPVVGNVFVDTNVPQTPVAAIVALDASGNELYRIR